MDQLKLGLGLLLGLVLGVALCRTPQVKANPQESGSVHVAIVPVRVLDAKNLTSVSLPGGGVAGISCIPKPQQRLPDAAVCYVATTGD